MFVLITWFICCIYFIINIRFLDFILITPITSLFALVYVLILLSSTIDSSSSSTLMLPTTPKFLVSVWLSIISTCWWSSYSSSSYSFSSSSLDSILSSIVINNGTTCSSSCSSSNTSSSPIVSSPLSIILMSVLHSYLNFATTFGCFSYITIWCTLCIPLSLISNSSHMYENCYLLSTGVVK